MQQFLSVCPVSLKGVSSQVFQVANLQKKKIASNLASALVKLFDRF
jgi:hypothetical protein